MNVLTDFVLNHPNFDECECVIELLPESLSDHVIRTLVQRILPHGAPLCISCIEHFTSRRRYGQARRHHQH